MSKCPTCNKPCNGVKSVIKHGQIFDGCDSCLSSQVQSGDSASSNRRHQQAQFRRELTQPNQRDYARAYPDDFRKRHGDELFRQMG